MSGKVVLAYSGGLDTSVSIKWIKEKYDLDVVTCTIDVGQKEDFEEIRERAFATGAINHYTIDAKQEFVKSYIFKSIKANSLYEGEYPNSTALARPLLAKKLVEIAQREKAEAVAHGCTGKGNDQVRFDVTVKALDPSLRIIAPVREWNLDRDSEIKYAKEHNIPISISKSKFSVDQNLWGRSIEGGPLEDPFEAPPQDAFEWCAPAANAPNIPQYLEIGFEFGEPVSIDGKKMDPVQLIKHVNAVAGMNGCGIVDHIEDRLVGIKSREIYECPGALALIRAHKDLEKLVLTRHELSFKSQVEQEWTWLVYSGLWSEPLREALEQFIEKTQRRVSGTVRMQFLKGSMTVVGRKSENSLYLRRLSTYGTGSSFDQNSATGFIELWGLSTRLANRQIQKISKEDSANRVLEEIS